MIDKKYRGESNIILDKENDMGIHRTETNVADIAFIEPKEKQQSKLNELNDFFEFMWDGGQWSADDVQKLNFLAHRIIDVLQETIKQKDAEINELKLLNDRYDRLEKKDLLLKIYDLNNEIEQLKTENMELSTLSIKVEEQQRELIVLKEASKCVEARNRELRMQLQEEYNILYTEYKELVREKVIRDLIHRQKG